MHCTTCRTRECGDRPWPSLAGRCPAAPLDTLLFRERTPTSQRCDSRTGCSWSRYALLLGRDLAWIGARAAPAEASGASPLLFAASARRMRLAGLSCRLTRARWRCVACLVAQVDSALSGIGYRRFYCAQQPEPVHPHVSRLVRAAVFAELPDAACTCARVTLLLTFAGARGGGGGGVQ